jgi:hypothetical protein
MRGPGLHFLFGELKGDGVLPGVDKLTEVPGFDQRLFAPENELSAHAGMRPRFRLHMSVFEGNTADVRTFMSQVQAAA